MTEVLAFIVVAVALGESLAIGIPLVAEAATIAMTAASVFSGHFTILASCRK